MDAEPALKLVVCLGNPGREYQGTRHNAGWMTAERILESSPFQPTDAFWQPAGGRLVWTGLGGRSVLLLLPQTYMNLSGEAVAETLAHFRITPSEMLAICDDLDLPEGSLRLRRNGSSGGHRGLASIMLNLQTTDFPRLRVGIGRPRPGSGTTIVEWVLSPWVSDVPDLPCNTTRNAAQVAATFATRSFQMAAAKANGMGEECRTKSNRS